MAMNIEHAKREVAPQISGVTNVTYDLISLLHNKLEGVAAFEEYKLDAQDEGDQEVMRLFEELERREAEDVQKLKECLSRRIQA